MRALAILVFTLAFASCSGGGAHKAETPTSVAEAFTTVRGPLPQSAALSGSLILKTFALDVGTRDVYVFSGVAPVSWLDDQTLFAPFYSMTADRGYHLLGLDGTDTVVNDVPPTPAPPSPPPKASADGRWRLTNNGTSAYLEDVSSGRRIVVPAAETYLWSPRGHLLATGGGRCGDTPVSFVNPDDDTPVHQVDLNGAIARSYTWRPDASGLALATIQPSQIVFADARTLATQLLAPVSPATMGGEPIPGPWSPSGAYFLFSLYFSRPCPY